MQLPICSKLLYGKLTHKSQLTSYRAGDLVHQHVQAVNPKQVVLKVPLILYTTRSLPESLDSGIEARTGSAVLAPAVSRLEGLRPNFQILRFRELPGCILHSKMSRSAATQLRTSMRCRRERSKSGGRDVSDRFASTSIGRRLSSGACSERDRKRS